MASQGTNAVASQQLRRGVNVTGWLAQGQSYDPNRFETFITTKDIQAIKNLGLDHIRLPINPQYFMDESRPSQIKSQYMGFLNKALDLILRQGLSVIVDLHPNIAFKTRLAKEDSFVDTVSIFWKALAQNLSNRNPEKVFLEVLNEPNFEALLSSKSAGLNRWQVVQEKLIASIRQGAPKHTIIATGSDLDTITGLTQMRPVSDRNVIYAVHFYEPYAFTHQGAPWIPGFQSIKGLTYPTNSLPQQRANPNLNLIAPSAEDSLAAYYGERWNAAKIESEIAKLSTWAHQNNVTVITNEFGVYKPNVATSDRMAWLQDVRSALEKFQIGWTMWDYAGGFGMTNGKAANGDRLIDYNVTNALGLTKAPALVA